MNRKKKILIALGVIVAVVLISGVSILAATNLGTSSDPLVTLSYLTNKLRPQIMSDVSANISAAEVSMSSSLDTKLDAFEADINARVSGSGQTGFTVVTLSKDQTVTCAAGAEVMLRVGTASAAGGSPALVDTTAGSTLVAGDALTANHLYMVTIQSSGLKATGASVKILIRGTYTVS
ncbi:hypothetical protein IZU99_09010 [Oscillospiraceae bacterium CM]|nr:hypothetical protein IZU99_09010 [Oscillospiraceae bacterium CM]